MYTHSTDVLPCPRQDYDIVLPLMAAAGISSLVVEVFGRADSEKPAVMPRDMSLEIGIKISDRVDEVMGKVQVCPRSLRGVTSRQKGCKSFRKSRYSLPIKSRC